MNIKRGKRAQFYIIAAVIIVIIILGLAGITNYVLVKEEPEEFYDLADILQREGDWSYSFAIYEGTDTDVIIDQFANSFAKYVQDNKEKEFDLIIIYGNKNEARVIIPSAKETGGVGVTIGDVVVDFPTTGNTVANSWPIQPDENGFINFTIEGTNFSYQGYLGENEDFLFYMTTDQDYEKVVTTNIEQWQERGE